LEPAGGNDAAGRLLVRASLAFAPTAADTPARAKRVPRAQRRTASAPHEYIDEVRMRQHAAVYALVAGAMLS
jgi:hypothetical protein